MKLNSLLCGVLLLSISGLTVAQEYAASEPASSLDKVVILAYRNRTAVDSLDVLEDLIRQAISTRLISTGNVLIVSQDEVQAVMDTLVADLGYLTNERQAYRLGNALGAGTVIFGSFTKRGESVSIKTYMVDCEEKTVHVVEQPEPDLDLASGQVAVETARVVQGEVAGKAPIVNVPGRKPEPVSKKISGSPAAHLTPWLALGASAGFAVLTYHYEKEASDTWDLYRSAIRKNEITRLYNEASDHLLARNALGMLTLASVAMSVHYWFAHDYGESEQWSVGATEQRAITWSATPVVSVENVGLTITRRF